MFTRYLPPFVKINELICDSLAGKQIPKPPLKTQTWKKSNKYRMGDEALDSNKGENVRPHNRCN